MSKFKIKKMNYEEQKDACIYSLENGNLYNEEIDMLNHAQGVEVIKKNVKDYYKNHTSVHIATYKPESNSIKRIEIWISFAPCHFFKFKYYEDRRHIITISTGSGSLDDYWNKLKPMFDLIMNSMVRFTFDTHFNEEA